MGSIMAGPGWRFCRGGCCARDEDSTSSLETDSFFEGRKDGTWECRAGTGGNENDCVARPEVVAADARGMQLDEEATVERRIKTTRNDE